MLEDLAFRTNPPASFKLTDWNFSLRNYEKLTALGAELKAAQAEKADLEERWLTVAAQFDD